MLLHSRGLLLFVAIMFSAWYGGMKPGILASILAAASFTAFFNDQHGIHPNLINATRAVVYIGAASTAIWLMAQRNRALANALTAKDALERALEEIRVLRGILPICMHCKQIRDGEGSWQEVERYIAEQTEARFSHGVCPDCMTRFYPDVRLQNSLS
jgi:nucleoside-diphosphate-sugar epimerase